MADSSEYELAPSPKGEPPRPRPLPPSLPGSRGSTPSPFDDDEEEVENEAPSTPTPPRPSPPKPLPRISRTAPLTVDEAEPDHDPKQASKEARRQSSPTRKDRDRSASATASATTSQRAEETDDKPKLEATPEFDTYEARQRIRVVLGAIAAGAVLLAIFMVLRTMGGSGPAEEMLVIHEADMFPPAALKNVQGEAEAAELLRRARLAAEPGMAISQLKRITEYYPDTSTARQAQAALNRVQRGLPPFPEGPEPVAQAPTPADTDPFPEPTPAQEPNLIALAPEPEPAPEPAPRPVDQTRPRPEPAVVAPRLPLGFQAAEGAEVHESGWPLEIVGERDDVPMVLIPPGAYFLGRDEGSPAESPSHQVLMPAYYIDRHEVTVGQYERYREAMEHRGETVFPRLEDLQKVAPTPEHPVVVITAEQARKYAQWAGKALPSEAQWEVAARGSDGRNHPWGAGPPTWSSDRAPRQIDPVMSHPEDVSPFGVFDMAGNVWEWTADWYDARHYEGRRGRIVRNPGGPSRSPSSPPQITIKGSSKTWDLSYREGMRPDVRLPYLGFRCVLSVGGEPQIMDAPRPPPAEPAPKRQQDTRKGQRILVPF